MPRKHLAHQSVAQLPEGLVAKQAPLDHQHGHPENHKATNLASYGTTKAVKPPFKEAPVRCQELRAISATPNGASK